jgi:two-component system sensor histidine kinase/response regulator
MRVRADAGGSRCDPVRDRAPADDPDRPEMRLRQALYNLVGNAIKFTEIGGVRVLVGLEEDPDEPCLRIEVADTGIGMTRDQADRVFQPFAQADSSTTRKFGGTGLGLHISNRLAGMLGRRDPADLREGRGHLVYRARAHRDGARGRTA